MDRGPLLLSFPESHHEEQPPLLARGFPDAQNWEAAESWLNAWVLEFRDGHFHLPLH